MDQNRKSRMEQAEGSRKRSSIGGHLRDTERTSGISNRDQWLDQFSRGWSR